MPEYQTDPIINFFKTPDLIKNLNVTYENVFVLITNFLFAKKELEDIKL